MYGPSFYKGRASTRRRCATRRKRTRRFAPPTSAARRSRSSGCSTATRCAVRPHLEARHRLADGRSAPAAHAVEITGRHRRPAQGVFTASGKAIEFAGFLRAYVEGSDDPSAELGEQETLLPKLTVGERVHAPDALDAAVIVAGIDRRATDDAAGPLHGSLTREALEEEGHRPSLDLRADGGHHPAPRLRHPPGQGARAELHRLRRHSPAA
jgi:hypothetical protein